MTTYYVRTDFFKTTNTDVIRPKVRKFTSGEKARAYAIVVMNRLKTDTWTVYSDAKCTRTAYVIEKRKKYYNTWDLKINRDCIVRTNGKMVVPDYSTHKPYWGQGNPKKLKAYYVKDSNVMKARFKPIMVMASDIKDFRRRILDVKIPAVDYVYVYTGKNADYLIGAITQRGSRKYWSGFDPSRKAHHDVWGPDGEIYLSGDADHYRRA